MQKKRTTEYVTGYSMAYTTHGGFTEIQKDQITFFGVKNLTPVTESYP